MRTGLLAVTLMILATQNVYSDVTITGTRIIFPSNQDSVTVQLNNPAKTPALIQSWLDDGDPKVIPSADKIPFILVPALTTIQPQKGQMIRLLAKDTSHLPKDRETLYWFNILDIPPTSTDSSEKNKLNISIRSRIKLFYRPIKLNMTQDKAFTALSFKYLNSDQSIKISNPSPYYISFMNLSLNPEQDNLRYSEPLMVAPFSDEVIKPKLTFKPYQVKYELINDYGSSNAFTTNIEEAFDE
ncbi:fimbrial biogenesis chaperone [Acinetobacter larvae]|uniref:Fimbrial chaperone protein n=1 Tax=Acinetobacter larvae TaxID=1789224 RepID=A0A1B2LWK4_9GAMM|nr:fimbria/pilus periplasmic chaperone [Acinetobacter larvae]AOA57328.1 fimbrial chaperone protein [Acinetobacter larvae]